MSKICEICGKGPATGNYVSHSHRKMRRRWIPNLQRVKAVTDKGVKRIWVCTTCIHSGKVKKAV